jgi:hypothetical protein
MMIDGDFIVVMVDLVDRWMVWSLLMLGGRHWMTRLNAGLRD